MKIDLNSSDYYAGIQQSVRVTNEMTASLREFDTVLKSSQGDLNAAAASLTQMMAAQRAAAAASKDMAQAKIAEAKATADSQRAVDQHNESLGRQEVSAQRAGQAQEQAHLATTRAANDSARTQGALTAQLQQGEVAQQRLTMAQERHSSSQERAKQNELELQDNLSNTRYLLYDVGATLELTSGALIAFSSASTVAAASYQKDFAQVLRISDQTLASAQSLRDGLVHLTTDVPVNFDEATGIAQMGAHLQLGNEGLVAFTDTVAKFTAATGTTAEASATLFSRMKTMMGDSADAGTAYFDKLGSSLAQVGTISKVNDSAVASMTTSISAATASARIGTAETVGLASALASLAVQPEMARGALTRLFASFNRDSADSTEKMAAFGKVMGVTGDQANALWKSDPNKFFMDLVKGLHDAYASGQNLTVLFDDMGIKNVRDVNTLSRLAVGYDQLTESMDAATKGYKEGTALNELSKPVFDTLAAKAQELGNAIKGFLDKIGSAGLAPLTSLVDGLKNFIVMLTDMQDKAPVLTVIINTLLGIGAVAGVLLGVRAAMAFVLAGLVSFQQAMAGNVAGSLSLNGILRQVAATMLVSKGASDELANSLVRSEGGFRALTLAAGASKTELAGMAVATDATAAASNRAAIAGNGFTGGLKAAGSALMGLVGGLPGLITLISVGLVGALIAAEDEAMRAGKTIAEAMQQGGDNGTRAIATELTNRKVGLLDSAAWGDLNKNVSDIAEQVGIRFGDIVNSVSKGSGAVEDFNKVLEQAAKNKGMSTHDYIAANADDIEFLKDAVRQFGAGAAQGAKDLKAVNDVAPETKQALAALEAGGQDGATGLDAAETAAQKLDKTLKALNDSIFGTINSQATLGDALQKVGQGLYKSGSFGNDEGGRANVKNMQDALRAAQDYYATLVKANQLTKDQGNAGYADFVNQLINRVKATGGNLGGIEDLARATVDKFKSVIGSDATGANAPKIAVTADATPALAKAAAVPKTAQDFIDAQGVPTVGVSALTDDAQLRIRNLAINLAQITGYPYQVVLDALTKPGADKAKEVKALLASIENHTYVAPVNANTSAAITNVQNFVNYARAALASLNGQSQETSNTLARLRVPGFTAGATGAPASIARPADNTPSAPAQVAAPVMDNSDVTGANNALLGALDNIGDGYDKAGDKAEKAAKKGTKGAEDQANGLNAAAQAAEDYANRLKQGLDHAFQMQYGLSAATDAYHQKLNEINKARDDENQKVSDLRDKIRQLKDDQQTELVDANKAKIEQTISVKYGETARAEDYGSQAQKHLDTAAAKQKEIDANQKDADTTQAGIGQLDGYTDAAIKNRAALRDLEQKHLDMVVAYARTGASVDQVRAYTQQLDAQFANDVSQLGFNQNAVNGLIGNLGRYIGVVNSIPYVKPTTVTANTDPATQALRDFNNFANAMTAPKTEWIDVKIRGGARMEMGRDGPIIGPSGQPVWDIFDSNGNMMADKVFNAGGEVQGFATGGLIPGSAPSDPSADNMMASVDGKGYIKVRSREFIQPQEAVDYYGMQFMEDIRRMRLPKFSAASGPSMMASSSGGGGGGMQVTSLSADSLAMLAKMSDRPIYLFTNDEVIARSAARGNTVLATKGVS